MTSSEPVLSGEPVKRELPFATFALLAGCWVMALVTFPGNPDGLLIRLFRFGAKENHALAAGEYWRLLSTAFLHGGMIHLLVNSYSLYVLGRLTEKVLGRTRFLATYFVSAATGSLASWAFNSYIGVGASGAIFGLLGTALYLSWRGKTAHIPPTALRSLGMWTVYNLVYGFITPTIDNSAHLGGLAGGVLCAIVLTGETVPLMVVAVSVATLGWGGLEIARAPDITPQVIAFFQSEDARTKGDAAAELAELSKAPDFAPAVATLGLRRLQRGDAKGGLELADSALKLLADSSRRARAFRGGAEAFVIDSKTLRARTNLSRAWALVDLGRPEEGLIAARAADSSPDPVDRRKAQAILDQAANGAGVLKLPDSSETRDSSSP